MTEIELHAVARRQLADYDRHTPGTIFGDGPVEWDIDDAYAVQLAVAELRQQRGEVVAGYKIGCVSDVIRKQLGISHAVVGHIFEGEILKPGVALDPSNFDKLAIEGEFAVRIANDIPDAINGDPEEFVSALFPVIELHNARIRADRQSAVELVANNAIHAGVVMASGGDIRREIGLSVSINGDLKGVATMDPLSTLPELVERLTWLGKRLKKGDIVLTGSPLPLYPVAPGDSVLIEAEGMQPIRLSVSACESNVDTEPSTESRR